MKKPDKKTLLMWGELADLARSRLFFEMLNEMADPLGITPERQAWLEKEQEHYVDMNIFLTQLAEEGWPT